MKLAQDQLDQFDREGWVFLPEVFDPEEVGALTGELPKIFAMDREEVWREKDGESVRTAFAAHYYNEAFRRLGRHPRLIGPVMQLLDGPVRSEEHTSELQSLMRISYAVFCLKKKKQLQ